MAETTLESDLLTRDQVAVEDTWDLDGIFPSGEAWEAALAEAPALIDGVAAFRGRLGEGPSVVKQAFDALYHAEDVLGRVMTWASLRRDEDTTDVERNSRYERAVAVAIKAGSVLAFMQPELIALPAGRDRGIRDLAPLPDGRLLALLGPAQEQSRPHSLMLVDTARPAAAAFLGELPARGEGKAESLTVLAQDRGGFTALIGYDGRKNGHFESYRLPLPAGAR